jgi:anti-sigma factor RsiW
MPHYTHASISTELSDKQLEGYLLGRIQDHAELTRVETHLEGCPECANRIQLMTFSIVALIGAVRREIDN